MCWKNTLHRWWNFAKKSITFLSSTSIYFAFIIPTLSWPFPLSIQQYHDLFQAYCCDRLHHHGLWGLLMMLWHSQCISSLLISPIKHCESTKVSWTTGASTATMAVCKQSVSSSFPSIGHWGQYSKHVSLHTRILYSIQVISHMEHWG